MIDRSSPSLLIRSAESEDCSLILAMIRELAEYERLSHEVEATEEGLRQCLFGNRPAAEVVIGLCGSDPVAYALFFQTFSTFTGRPGLYVEDVYVRPEARRRGIGESLFRHLIALAKGRGYGRVEWSVLNWNTPALEFYGKLGARPMSEWTLERISLTDYHQG